MKELRINRKEICEVYYDTYFSEEDFENIKKDYKKYGYEMNIPSNKAIYDAWLKDMTFEDFCAYIKHEKDYPEKGVEYESHYEDKTFTHTAYLEDVIEEIVNDALYNCDYDFGDTIDRDDYFEVKERD